MTSRTLFAQPSPAGPRSPRSRIAKAAQKLKAEAERALAQEGRPARPRAALPQALPSGYAEELGEADRASLVEVSDGCGRTLLCMPPEAALRQGLRLRYAALVLRTRQNRIVLHRRRDQRLAALGSWDLYTGFVMAGEATEDAAFRLLETVAVIGKLGLSRLVDLEDERQSLALFVADLPLGVYPAHPAQELLEVDADELQGLIDDVPELLSPALKWSSGTGRLFRGQGKNGP